jgi:hypothetical protein
MADIKVHILDETHVTVGLYAITQTAYYPSDDASFENPTEIRDGDVFVVASEGIVGFLCGAWPVVVIGPDDPFALEEHDLHGLHTIDWETRDVSTEHPANSHEASILKCAEIAESDADITGNDSWAQQAESIRKLVG